MGHAREEGQAEWTQVAVEKGAGEEASLRNQASTARETSNQDTADQSCTASPPALTVSDSWVGPWGPLPPPPRPEPTEVTIGHMSIWQPPGQSFQGGH